MSGRTAPDDLEALFTPKIGSNSARVASRYFLGVCVLRLAPSMTVQLCLSEKRPFPPSCRLWTVSCPDQHLQQTLFDGFCRRDRGDPHLRPRLLRRLQCPKLPQSGTLTHVFTDTRRQCWNSGRRLPRPARKTSCRVEITHSSRGGRNRSLHEFFYCTTALARSCAERFIRIASPACRLSWSSRHHRFVERTSTSAGTIS